MTRMAQRLRDTLLPRALVRAVPGAVARGPGHDDEGRPLLYLTVDDGPDPNGTPLWLDALDRHDARAVFFLSSPRAAARRDLTRQLAATHRIGNHGADHRSAWTMRPAAVRDAFNRAEATLTEIVETPVRDVRPPYGRVTPGLVAWASKGQRRLILWDTMPGDFLTTRSPDVLAAELLATVRPGSIVALHDGPPAERATAALDMALPRLAAAGWRFPMLPALP